MHIDSGDVPNSVNINLMKLALSEAEKCEPVPSAFCVGCVLAVGYSRELPGNTHAEANALTKARSIPPENLRSLFPDVGSDVSVDDLLCACNVYTTMEPCSVRASGLSPCADALIEAKVKRCFIGVKEPDDFVTCDGARKLEEAGIAVVWLSGLERQCLEIARRGHSKA